MPTLIYVVWLRGGGLALLKFPIKDVGCMTVRLFCSSEVLINEGPRMSTGHSLAVLDLCPLCMLLAELGLTVSHQHELVRPWDLGTLRTG